MILVGYHSTTGYKFYDVGNRRTLISINFTFDKIKEVQQSVTNCSKSATDYTVEKIISRLFERVESTAVEARIEEML